MQYPTITPPSAPSATPWRGSTPPATRVPAAAATTTITTPSSANSTNGGVVYRVSGGSVGTVPTPPSASALPVGGTVIREGSPQPHVEHQQQQQQLQRSTGVSVSPSPVPMGPSSASSSLTSGAAVVSATSSPGSAAAMLSHPLVMQATVLRNPDWFEQSSMPELVEPGDILYDVLRVPQLAFEGEECFRHTRAAAKTKGRKEKASSSSSPPLDETATAAGDNEALSATPPPPLPFAPLVVSTPTFGIQPLLSLPDKVGAYVTRESFKALLCFHNSAAYPLSDLRFRIDVVSPPQQQQQQQQQQQTSLLTIDLAGLAAKANYTFPIEVLLNSVGTFTLSVHVYYQDPTQTERKLRWASSFAVEQAVTETAQRVLHRVPLPKQQQQQHGSAVSPSSQADGQGENLYRRIFKAESESARAAAARLLTLDDAVKDLRLPRCSYALTVGLKNSCSVPIVLTDVALKLPKRSPCVILESESLNTTTATGTSQQQEQQDKTLVPQGHHMQPGEQRQYTFRFLIDPAALATTTTTTATATAADGGQYAAPPAPSPTKTNGSSPVSLLGPALAAGIGCVEWGWRRANGDGGRERSSVIRLGRARATPEVELLVLRVRPTASPSASAAARSPTAAGDSATARATSHTPCSAPRLRAGRPVEVELCLIYSPHQQQQQQPSPHPLAPSRTTSTADLLLPPGSATQAIITGTAVPSGAPPAPAHLDVALKVRAEKLAPNFLYSGPALRPLGLVGAGTPLTLTLTLLPWRSGLLPLLRDAVQIVDARTPEVILWPWAPSADTPTGASSPGGGSPTGPAAAATTGSSASVLPFADRFLVSPAMGTVLDGAGGVGNKATAMPTAASSELAGGNGTAPAVAAVALQVVEDTIGAGGREDRPAVLCEMLVL